MGVQKSDNFKFFQIRHGDVAKNEIQLRLACSRFSSAAPEEVRHFCA